jgi:hypothetical protein
MTDTTCTLWAFQMLTVFFCVLGVSAIVIGLFMGRIK